MDVNDDAAILNERGAFEFFASKLCSHSSLRCFSYFEFMVQFICRAQCSGITE